MRWLKRHHHENAASDDDRRPLETLESQLGDAMMSITRSIRDQWTDVTGQPSMSRDARITMLLETWWFLLHVVDRVTFQTIGPEARDTLVDDLASSVAAEVVSVFRDAGGTNEFTAGDSDRALRAAEQFIDGFNAANSDYGSFPHLLGDPKDHSMSDLRGETVVGNFAARIARELGQEHNFKLHLLILLAAIGALTTLKVTHYIENACHQYAASHAISE